MSRDPVDVRKPPRVIRLARVSERAVIEMWRTPGRITERSVHIGRSAVNTTTRLPQRVVDTARSLRSVTPGMNGSRPRRGIWQRNGRLHIDLRLVIAERFPEFASELKRSLEEIDAVQWAHVVPALGRVVVAVDDPGPSLDEILDVVEGVEEDCGAPLPMDDDHRPEHPGDIEPIVRTATALAGDVFGLGLSAFGAVTSFARVPILSIDVSSLITFVENVPALRRVVENRIGRRAADVALAVSNAVAHGLARNPFGPAVDSAYRSLLLLEFVSRRRVWTEREPDLCDRPADTTLLTQIPRERPAPLRAGPIEEYAQRAWYASLGGSAAALALTRNLERTSAALAAGIPKAARLGREAFAATLARTLAARGVVVVNPIVLRAVDRIDIVFVEADLLAGEGFMVRSVVATDDLSERSAERKIAALFDPGDPTATRADGDLLLGPLSDLPVETDDHVDAIARRLSHGSTVVLGLVRGGRLVAVAGVGPAIARDARELLRSIRDAGIELALVSDDPHARDRFDVERVVPVAGATDAVLDVQFGGRGVGYIGSRPSVALSTADCGIGVTLDNGSAPWGASLIGHADLADARFIIDAMSVARGVSRRSTQIAVVGAGLGGFLTFVGPPPRATPRVMFALNAATAVSMANGIRAATTLAYRPDPITRDPTPWHMLSVEDVLLRVASREEGLNSEEALARRPASSIDTWRSGPLELMRAITDELVNPLTPVLAAGAGLSAAVGSVFDAAMVSGVVLLNAGISGVQRYRTARAVSALARGGSKPAVVLRNGEDIKVPSDEIVVGDVLALSAGDAISADCRIISSSGLEVDESSLTGESLPVAKRPDPTVAATVAERTSMLYDGTSVAAGEARAVVVAAGKNTETRAALEENGGELPETGVETRLRKLTMLTAPVSAGAGAAVVGAGLLRGLPIVDLAAAGVSLAVAAAPEGLPLLATVAQLGAARRLGSRGVLVRNHRAVEALGRVNVVCFDKTGTLTEGRIALHVVSDGLREERAEELDTLRSIVATSVRASPASTERITHATDRALVRGGQELGITDENGEWRRIDEMPFEPARGFHAVLGQTPDGLRIAVKGAPEVVIPLCTTLRRDDGDIEIDDGLREHLVDVVDSLARRGLRVLAVAQRSASSTGDLDADRVSNLVLRGFVGLADPVRGSAAEAVDGLRRAGVATVMITGDHPTTAEGIASELGLWDSSSAVLTGPQIDAMEDEELDRVIEDTTVFARVTPTHKVRIVRAYQRTGRVVAMTGDGANDAPAIRLADVGIALGERSTAAAREAADLVVLDDRIETIVHAVVEGRALWTSVRHSVATLVGGNFGEIGFTAAGAMALGRPPLNARQLLLVNLMTDVVPAMAIALRPPQRRSPEDLINEGPDASLGGRLTRAIATRAVTTAAGAGVAYIGARATGTAARASSVSLIALVGTQLGQTIVTAGHDPVVTVAALGSAVLLGAIVQTPGVSQIFGCRPVGPVGWGIATASSVAATGAAAIIERARG